MYIETSRLSLKPFQDKDMDQAIDMFVNDQIKQTYMLPDFETREAAAKLFYRLKDLSLAEGRYVVGVYLKDEDRLIGFMNDVEIVGDEIELGYVIDPAYHNKGYATEALQGMIGYLLENGFGKVITGAFEENQASIRFMEKNEMKKLEKIDEIPYRGKTHRCVYYCAEKN